MPLSGITTPTAQLADWKMYVHLRCYSRIIQSHDKLPMKVNLNLSQYWGWATRQDTRGNNTARYAAFAWSCTQRTSNSFNWRKANTTFHFILAWTIQNLLIKRIFLPELSSLPWHVFSTMKWGKSVPIRWTHASPFSWKQLAATFKRSEIRHFGVQHPEKHKQCTKLPEAPKCQNALPEA